MGSFHQLCCISAVIESDHRRQLFTNRFVSVLLLNQIIVGNFGLSHDQERVQMAVWAILAAPLLMSNDLRNIRKESRNLLLNRNLIAINQDPLGIAGTQVTVSHRSISFFFGRGTSHLKTGYVRDNDMKNNSFVFKYFLYFVFVF